MRFAFRTLLLCWVGLLAVRLAPGQDETGPPVNPFGPRAAAREDAREGLLELSDGQELRGGLYLTRGARLQLLDPKTKQLRQIPWARIRSIEAVVEREWLEREWRFRENANDEKVYTGRTYPARECSYVVTLDDGRELSGRVTALVFLVPQGTDEADAQKFILHERDKGEVGQDLDALVYVRRIDFAAPTDASADSASSAPEPAPEPVEP